MTRVAAEPVIKRKTWPFDNRDVRRLPLQQVQILAVLPLYDDSLRGTRQLPHFTTGMILDRIGRPRTKVAFASVSRSLLRMHDAGLVLVFTPGCLLRGAGYLYFLTELGQQLATAASEAFCE